jgi:hypothetical protein
VAVASASLFAFVGALGRSTTSEEDMEEACDALFGKTPDNFEKLGAEMAKLSDEQTSYKWRAIATMFVPNDRRLDQDVVERLQSKYVCGLVYFRLPLTAACR